MSIAPISNQSNAASQELVHRVEKRTAREVITRTLDRCFKTPLLSDWLEPLQKKLLPYVEDVLTYDQIVSDKSLPTLKTYASNTLLGSNLNPFHMDIKQGKNFKALGYGALGVFNLCKIVKEAWQKKDAGYACKAIVKELFCWEAGNALASIGCLAVPKAYRLPANIVLNAIGSTLANQSINLLS
jgi:hypothetical protein